MAMRISSDLDAASFEAEWDSIGSDAGATCLIVGGGLRSKAKKIANEYGVHYLVVPNGFFSSEWNWMLIADDFGFKGVYHTVELHKRG